MKTPLFFAMLACTGSLHAQVLIDDFSSGEFTSGPTDDFFVSPGTMLGGHRGSFVGVAGSSTTVSVADGTLNIQINPDQGFYIGRWGRNAVSEENDLHLDLRGKSLALDVASMTGPFSINVGLRSFSGSVLLVSSKIFQIAEPGIEYFLIDTFGSSANLADVSGIQLGIPGDSGQVGTYAIDSLSISLVPEPPQVTFVCASMLLAAFFYVRLKVRKSSSQ